ncbi:hypothetical protein L1887_15251 [Cichorium endivia]|nr:hypothetical protein L1887_15251 [Cichorium endivia]
MHAKTASTHVAHFLASCVTVQPQLFQYQDTWALVALGVYIPSSMKEIIMRKPVYCLLQCLITSSIAHQRGGNKEEGGDSREMEQILTILDTVEMTLGEIRAQRQWLAESDAAAND